MKKVLLFGIILFFSLFAAWFIFDRGVGGSLVASIPNMIEVQSPRINTEVFSPLIVSGRARGTWFFEGSFPLVLVDWDGLIIAEGFATAQSEWMTEEFVPFAGTLEFIKPVYGKNGWLILQKDNPSGLSENDAALEIPVIFK
ncbi:MAG: Gmad2 immunoglobulin-like domain-containing protein [Candidatus Campbellbacteria bacterium]|nr:Gmad2 immunoglobulin-like domain-containing protein [Candidatus Campbellbacteria bacterium]